MDLLTIPAHLRVTMLNKHLQYASAVCRFCGARAYIARYEEPHRAEILLEQWVARHTHG
jgi:hypothetical protein